MRASSSRQGPPLLILPRPLPSSPSSPSLEQAARWQSARHEAVVQPLLAQREHEAAWWRAEMEAERRRLLLEGASSPIDLPRSPAISHALPLTSRDLPRCSSKARRAPRPRASKGRCARGCSSGSSSRRRRRSLRSPTQWPRCRCTAEAPERTQRRLRPRPRRASPAVSHAAPHAAPPVPLPRCALARVASSSDTPRRWLPPSRRARCIFHDLP